MIRSNSVTFSGQALNTYLQLQETEEQQQQPFCSPQNKVQIIRENETASKTQGYWKKIKDISKKEEKRPPWQMPSLSTLPKADKDALLRAKLHDVTRRLKNARSNVATQTDIIPTKLMKEVCTDIPYDLVSKVDAETVTDEYVNVRIDGPGIFLFTHSVGLMTDQITFEDGGTQTPTVKNLSINFNNTVLNGRIKQFDGEKNKKKILDQIQNIKETNKKLNIAQPSYLSDAYIKSFLAEAIPTKTDFLCNSNGFNTYSYWSSNFFDYFSNFKLASGNVVEDEKTLKMLLSPNNKKPILKNRPNSWNEMQKNAVFILLREASGLQKVFEEIAFILGPALKYQKVFENKFEIPQFLSDKFEPLLKSSRELINEQKAAIKEPTLLEIE